MILSLILLCYRAISCLEQIKHGKVRYGEVRHKEVKNGYVEYGKIEHYSVFITGLRSALVAVFLP